MYNLHISSGSRRTRAEPQAFPQRRRTDATPGVRDGLLYLALGLLTACAWWISSLKLFTPNSDMGYWIGVAGGVTMLGVFAYPMRKHLRFMQRWGAGRHWFIVHMFFGVAGPFLILVHSTFTIGSINAGVALFSMVIVATSGVIGRFIYVRVHRDLHGQRLSLDELRQAVGGDDSAIARLRFAPAVQEELRVFEAQLLGAGVPPWQRVLRRSPAIVWQRWRAARRCRAELRLRLMAVARSEGWTRQEFRRRLRTARQLATDYLLTVQRIAQYRMWERLFSLWHVAHVPFVYLMVLSAIAHVVAVHVY